MAAASRDESAEPRKAEALLHFHHSVRIRLEPNAHRTVRYLGPHSSSAPLRRRVRKIIVGTQRRALSRRRWRMGFSTMQSIEAKRCRTSMPQRVCNLLQTFESQEMWGNTCRV